MTNPDYSARPAGRPHVVVLGGGFGGLSAVKSLRRVDVDITLVDRHPYNTFQPLLYQVATAALNPGDVTYFLRAARMTQRNVRFRQGQVTGLTPAEQEIVFEDGGRLRYDYLVLATGATTHYFGTPGAAQHAHPIYTRIQALALRNEMFTRLERAAGAADPPDLGVVVVGAGPTGVEMAGALAELRNDTMTVLYPELDPQRASIVLVEMTDKVLAPFHPRLRDHAAAALARRGVQLRLNTSVAQVREDGVLLASGEFLRAGIVIWAAGVTVAERVKGWGLPQGRGGRISVGPDLRVTGVPTIFAIGDLAVADEPLPQLAQPALQGGRHAGHQIAALIAGQSTRPFRYRNKGTMATIGRRAAVAEIALPAGRMLRLTGTAAWLAWVFIHIVMLLGNRNRLATLVNLAARYVAPARRTNPIVGDMPMPDEPAARAGGS